METLILATKLYMPPPHPKAIARPALLARLQRGLEGKVTLVVAPAGCGKSTLLSQWLQTLDRPAAWVTLDPADNEPTRFLTYLITALQRLQQPADARWGEQSLALLASPQPPPIVTVLTTLINEVAYTARSLLLVLDDYQFIEAAAVHQLVDFLIAYLPPPLHLVIISRQEPPLTLARLRASGALTELKADELRFSTAEVAAFFATTVALPLADRKVATLTAHTTGWAAGLRLMAMRLQTGAAGIDREKLAATIANLQRDQRPIFDYLTVEIFERLPVDRQHFLVQSALLDRLCGDLCVAVTGNAQSQQLLAELAQEQLFLTGLDDCHHWYRYHGLFADFLRHRLRQLDPALVQELHGRAAHWHATHGLPAVAIDHALAAQHYALAVQVIETNVMQMVQTTEVANLAGWLRALPADLVADRPLLAFAQAGTALLQAQFDQANQWLDVAEQRLAALPLTAPLPLPLDTIHGYLDALRATTMVNLRQEVASIIAVSQRALAQLPADEKFLRGAVALNLGDAYCLQQENSRAEQAFAEAVALTQQANNLTPHLAALGSQGGLYARQGDLPRAAAIYCRAIELGKSWGKPTGEEHPATGKAYAFYAAILYEWNQLAAAEAAARQAIACCQRWGHLYHQMDGYVQLVNVLCAQHRFEEAVATLTTARLLATARWQQAQQQAAPTALAHQLMGAVEQLQLWLWLRQGRLPAVAQWLATEQLADRLALALMHTRLALAQAQWETAAHWLDELAQQLRRQTNKSGEITYLLLRAQLQQARHEPAAAHRVLAAALALATPSGYLRTFLDEGEPMAALLEQAAQRGQLSDYGRQVQRHFAPGLTVPPSATPLLTPATTLVEPLSARELEVLRLMAADLTHQAIGEQLVISLNTVRAHAKNIYSKLNVNRRSQAIARARTLALL